MNEHLTQQTYQVRMDWGIAGLQRVCAADAEPVDAVVVVDVLRCSSVVSAAVASGAAITLADVHRSRNGAPLLAAAAALPTTPAVFAGAFRNADATAAALMRLQEGVGSRLRIAIIAAGEGDAAGTARFAVEDLLGAGAIIAGLGDRGIDHVSPEAVAASESFRGLRGAIRHLLAASGTGRTLASGDRADVLREAGKLNADTVAARLVNGEFLPA